MRISDWSSDVCSSDLTIASDRDLEAGMGERIVAALLDKGRLKEPDLARARRLQEETGGNLLSLLGRLGLVSEREHAETCAEVMDLPLVAGKDAPDTPPELLYESQPLSLRFLKQFHMRSEEHTSELQSLMRI